MFSNIVRLFQVFKIKKLKISALTILHAYHRIICEIQGRNTHFRFGFLLFNSLALFKILRFFYLTFEPDAESIKQNPKLWYCVEMIPFTNRINYSLLLGETAYFYINYSVFYQVRPYLIQLLIDVLEDNDLKECFLLTTHRGKPVRDRIRKQFCLGFKMFKSFAGFWVFGYLAMTMMGVVNYVKYDCSGNSLSQILIFALLNIVNAEMFANNVFLFQLFFVHFIVLINVYTIKMLQAHKIALTLKHFPITFKKIHIYWSYFVSNLQFLADLNDSYSSGLTMFFVFSCPTSALFTFRLFSGEIDRTITIIFGGMFIYLHIILFVFHYFLTGSSKSALISRKTYISLIANNCHQFKTIRINVKLELITGLFYAHSQPRQYSFTYSSLGGDENVLENAPVFQNFLRNIQNILLNLAGIIRMLPYYSMLRMLHYSYQLKHSSGNPWKAFQLALHLAYLTYLIFALSRFLLAIYYLHWDGFESVDKDTLLYYFVVIFANKSVAYCAAIVMLISFWIYIVWIEVFKIDSMVGQRCDDLYNFSRVLINESIKQWFNFNTDQYRFAYDPFICPVYKRKLFKFVAVLELLSKFVFFAFSTIFLSLGMLITYLVITTFQLTIPKKLIFILDCSAFSFCLFNTFVLTVFVSLKMQMVIKAKMLAMSIEHGKLKLHWHVNGIFLALKLKMIKLHRMYVFYHRESVQWNRFTVYKTFTLMVLVNMSYSIFTTAAIIQGHLRGVVKIYSIHVLVDQAVLILLFAFTVAKLASSLTCFSDWIITNIAYQPRSYDYQGKVMLRHANLLEMIHHKKPYRYSFGVFGKISFKSVVWILIYYSGAILFVIKRFNFDQKI